MGKKHDAKLAWLTINIPLAATKAALAGLLGKVSPVVSILVGDTLEGTIKVPPALMAGTGSGACWSK